MPERDYSEEKVEEKELEKHDEKQEKDEKSMEEKWQRDPLGVICWGAILIWAGLVLLADNLGLLTQIPAWQAMPIIERPYTTALIVVGAGVILIFEALVRLVIPMYRRPVGGTLFMAFALIWVAVVIFFNMDFGKTWPVLLIVLGLSIFFGGLLRRN